MAWDDRAQGFHLFISPILSSSTTTHYFWDGRNNAWFPVSFSDTDNNALAIFPLITDDPNQRHILLGCRDGYIRYFNPSATTDDGDAISWYADIGPIQNKGYAFRVNDLQCSLNSNSANVSWAIRFGENAQTAYSATARFSGTFTTGRNNSQGIRGRGHAAYLRLSGTGVGVLESLQMMIEPISGDVAQRSW